MPSHLQVTQGGAADFGDPIAEIQARLRKYPQAKVSSTTDRVTVYPQDATGFEVTFEVRPTDCRVWCDGWHEEFTDTQAALNCFAFALSPACRLRTTIRGGMPYRWELQGRDAAGEWVTDSEVGLLLWPFWAPKRVVYLQNRLLEAA